MNIADSLNSIIGIITILSIFVAITGYILSIKRKVDSDVLAAFISEQRLALQKIESTLELIRDQMGRKINSEDIFEIRAAIKSLTVEVEALKHGIK